MRSQSCLLLSIICTASALAATDLRAVHEWGPFTSVAGESGAALSWEPLSGPSDLPCFVHRLDQRDIKVVEMGTVRMETPVLYFYPTKPLTVAVHVDFPNGRLTEWFPHATNVQPSTSRNGWIDWKNVELSSADVPLHRLDEPSHYYAARETDSWPLKSGGENEKLLFYRGIGDLNVDLIPTVHEDEVTIRNNGSETIPEVILFENNGGRIRYRTIRRLGEPVNVKLSSMNGTIDGLRDEMENELTEMGLYRKEARAMIQTWRDSWFEEGLRVFYILPRSKVDELLPLSIKPAPEQLTRVFVGWVELLSPSMRKEISAASVSGDLPVLKKYGRFLNAFLQVMRGAGADSRMCERTLKFLQAAHREALIESEKSACTN